MRFSRRSTGFSAEGRRLGAPGLLALAALFAAAVAAAPSSTPPLADRENLPKDRLFSVPFLPGETLVYTVAWLRIEGGEMTLSADRTASPDGVPVHHLLLTAVSNEYVSKFYPVNTRYETWVDARDFQPLRFEKRAREGRYVSDEVEEFDLVRRVGSWRTDRTPLPERVTDIISSFYFMRAQPLTPGTDVRLDMFSRGKLYRLVVHVQEKETVETEAGNFETVRVQPAMLGSGGEDHNRGRLFLWFSDDARRLPVKAQTLLPIGSVTARLKRVEPGGDG
ncbi:MAG TPA: DUF3108 domain-containing protein [Thermoanaerobaculia bacterium]|nr:DUF3108 domain-containing protein [Thermoanaerobaculia bacterium]